MNLYVSYVVIYVNKYIIIISERSVNKMSKFSLNF